MVERIAAQFYMLNLEDLCNYVAESFPHCCREVLSNSAKLRKIGECQISLLFSQADRLAAKNC